MRYSWRLAILSFCFIEICDLQAKINSGYCEPYYVSIKSSRANSHVGPGKNYKIIYTYVQKGTPLLVTAKYDHWRKIKDPNGDESWIHKSQLSSKRYVMTLSEEDLPITKNTGESEEALAYVKKNVAMRLEDIKGNWCNVSVDFQNKNFKGWVRRDKLFGIFKNETR
ncbi:MAG: hypothetical protein IJ481_02470 [Alphaproteobacteria bacterium]|nr:hypothetical protein [Alphaproteobacteria bacterium]